MKKIRFQPLLIALSILGILNSCKPDDNKVDSLSVTPASIEFEAIGGNAELSIKCSGTCELTHSVDWFSASEESFEGDAAITITAQENSSDNSRKATLYINIGDITKEVKVSQLGKGSNSGFKYDIEPDNTGMRDLTSKDFTGLMGVGWNIGNSLDAIGGETEWGNPLITQKLIDSVKSAGFNTVRIPVAWSKFSDEFTFTIETSWLNRVEEVVNYVLNNEMYAIVNIHWDGGWMQPLYADEAYVNERLDAMWDQIATHFRDYDDHLLFAGTNEVMKDGDYRTPTKEYYTVQNGFNQTFVTTVRKTGGKNAYRQLVVQGFNTNIDHTISFAVMPTDVIEDRLMMEVHYYDPYEFTLKEDSDITSQWGEIASNPDSSALWGKEDHLDSQFNRMKTKYVNNNIGVILGEYGATYRTAATNHNKYRAYYLEYLTQSAVDHGIVPIYWDNGYTGNHGFGIFNRSTGAQTFPELVSAITKAAK